MKRVRILAIILLIYIFFGCAKYNAFAADINYGKTITVGVPVDRCPVFYIDRKTKEIVGIGVDLMKAAAKEAELNVEFKQIEEETLKDALDNEEYDLVMPFGSAINSSSGKNSIVSDNLLHTPFTLVTLGDTEIKDINRSRVGMLKSLGGGAETVKQLYPGIEIILYDDMKGCVNALRAGEVDALMHNSYVWSYILQKPAYSALTLHPLSMFSMDFRAGTLDTEKGQKLIDILNEGIANIPETLTQAVVLDYTTRKLYKYDAVDYIDRYGFIAFVILSIIVFILYENGKLRAAQRVATEASKAKSMFLANMSHEIRTPINTIMGMGEMISRETRDDKVLQYSYSINRSANSLLCMVNDILDFSMMESGKLKLRSDIYNLSMLFSELEAVMKARADSKNITFKILVNENMPDELIGDETRLKQVLDNLVSNGIKFTFSGHVYMKVDYEKIDDDTVNLKISVEDTGIGMKKSEMDKLFIAFERLDEDRNMAIEGTGLGMSIVKQILDAMDSALTVSSNYGSGTTFSFSVKQKVAGWKKIGDYANTAKELVSGKGNHKISFIAPEVKILIVDDTEINIKVVKGLLEPTKMKITTALNGKDALKLMEEEKYDIIVLDYRMPEMDGIELLHHIKSDPLNLNYYSVCVVLTANVIEGARDMYIKAGFDEYLEKPVTMRQLERTLLKFLPKEKIIKIITDDEAEEQSNGD